MGDLPEAVRAHREATSRGRPQFLYCLAGCLIAQGRSDKALPLAIESAEEHQVDAHGWNQVGKCYFDLRMFEEAKTAYEKAIEFGPDYPNPWFDLGGLYWNHEMHAEALALWEQAIEKFPDHELVERVKGFLAS